MEQLITREELVKLLRGISRPAIVTVYTVTEPTMVKKHRETKEPNPFYGQVLKESRVNGVINFNYTNSVNNQRIREADPQTLEELHAVEEFVAEPRKWGERILGTPLVVHIKKGDEEESLYLELKVERSLGTAYYLNGNEMDLTSVASMKEYFPVEKEGRQQLEKPVILRDYAVETITALQYNGVLYRVAA